jgi:ribosomal protein S24E
MSTVETAEKPEIIITKKEESKLIGRIYVQALIKEAAGKLTRAQAVEILASEMKVKKDDVLLISLEQETGKRDVLGKFYVYTKEESKALHPRHLRERLLTKEEREKLKQERKKEKTKQPEGGKK